MFGYLLGELNPWRDLEDLGYGYPGFRWCSDGAIYIKPLAGFGGGELVIYFWLIGGVVRVE